MEDVKKLLDISQDLPEPLKPLSWLHGQWKTENGEAKLPRLSGFSYSEQLSFTCLGQPMLNFHSVSWHNTSKKPLHIETGVFKIQPGTSNVSVLCAHNFGVTTIEEGQIVDGKLTVKSTNISRPDNAKGTKVQETARTWSLDSNGDLLYSMSLGTDNMPLQEHLVAKYTKIDS